VPITFFEKLLKSENKNFKEYHNELSKHLTDHFKKFLLDQAEFVGNAIDQAFDNF